MSFLVEEAISGEATPEWLAEVHAALSRLWAKVDVALPTPPDEDWRARFNTAVAEIGSNIVRHAYPPAKEKGDVQVTLRALDDRIEAHFTDRGVPYEPAGGDREANAGTSPDAPAGEDALDDLDAVLALAEGGYGLALVRASVDEVDYARTPAGSNQWRLVKRLKGGRKDDQVNAT